MRWIVPAGFAVGILWLLLRVGRGSAPSYSVPTPPRPRDGAVETFGVEYDKYIAAYGRVRSSAMLNYLYGPGF